MESGERMNKKREYFLTISYYLTYLQYTPTGKISAIDLNDPTILDDGIPALPIDMLLLLLR